MVEFLISLFFAAFLLHNIHCYSVYLKLPEVYGENNRSHLKFKHIKVICNDRSTICKSNDTKICAMRILNKTTEYKDFENSCFLFLSNMCDTPGEEFNIVEGGSCAVYLESRRQMEVIKLVNATVYTTTAKANATQNATFSHNSTATPLPAILRVSTEVSKIYEIDTAFDFHICPLTCPDLYNPVCVSANRGSGKYFKFYTFVNHCQGDIYYCKHFDEFAPPPDEEEENVNSSPLSWSYCGAFRYMQFARFSEVLSSMNHYGWLVGDDRYSRIIPPHQRRPGVGR